MDCIYICQKNNILIISVINYFIIIMLLVAVVSWAGIKGDCQTGHGPSITSCIVIDVSVIT